MNRTPIALAAAAIVALLVGLPAAPAHAAPFHAADYTYSTAPDAHGTYYQDDRPYGLSSVGDMNDGVGVTVGAGAAIPDPSVGWNVNTSTDITFALGGLFRVDSISIGHAGIPNSAKWAPDDVSISFSQDGVTFGPGVTSGGFTLFTAPGGTYQRADLVLNQPAVASHVRLSFDGGVTQNTNNFNGYMLDDVSFDGMPVVRRILPYANNDPDTALLYHLNEATGLHSSQSQTNFIGDGSGNGQLLGTNYDVGNPDSHTSSPGISPFDGLAGPLGLGTAMTQNTSQRAFRAGNADVDLLNTQTFTIEAWIRNPAAGNYPGILRADTHPGANAELVQFSLDANGDQLRLAFLDATGAFRAYISTQTISFDPDTWYHVAVTYEGDGAGNDSIMKFYVDSENDYGPAFIRPGTQLGDILTGIQDINPFDLGDNGDIWVGEMQSANWLLGDIDEVRWSNVVRTEFNLAYMPEPTSLSLLALGGLALLRRRRRKRHASAKHLPLCLMAAIALGLLVGLPAVPAHAGVYRDTVLADGPVAYWRLGELAGTTAVSETASHNGTYQGGYTLGEPGATPGDPDAAVNFDGASGRVAVPQSAALNPGTFSAEVWAKAEGGAGTYRSPLTSRTHTGGQSGYIFYAANNNTWQYWVGTGTGWSAQTGPAVQIGAWTHLVGTYDGATERFYVNGWLVATTATAFQQNLITPLHIAAGGDTGTSFRFNGDVDEAAVYNSALTLNQVRSHYKAALPGMAPRLFNAEFGNPGGVGLGSDASAMTFAGRTGAFPSPTNPDGTLVLGGGGSGGLVFTQDLSTELQFRQPLVVETEAFYQGGAPAPGNTYMGLKALHLMGTSDSGPQRRGGLWAQFRAAPDGSGRLRLGFQSAETSPDGNDVWHDHADALDVVAGAIPDPDGLFNMQLAIYGLGNDDLLLFTVSQGAWTAEIFTTIGRYRNALGDILAAQEAFDLVLSELRADPWRMDFGFISTGGTSDAYNFLRVYAFTPEPGTLSLLALGGIGMLRRRRRKSKYALKSA